MFGIFGKLFDFNNDGVLDSTEQAFEMAMLQNIIDAQNGEDGSTDN